MITIKDLEVTVEEKVLLNELNLDIKAGEVHALMGPNGAGKSTLAKVIAGHPSLKVTNGSMEFDGKDLLKLKVHERACEGIFLSFQHPLEIEGVKTNTFLKTALNSKRVYNKQEPLSAVEFVKNLKRSADAVGIEHEMLNRALNSGFSGGEKKKNEILQMVMLKPKLIILDEIDSGLDIDALKDLSEQLRKLRTKENAFLIISHYKDLFEHFSPDFVHIIKNGTIVKDGSYELAQNVFEEGFSDDSND